MEKTISEAVRHQSEQMAKDSSGVYYHLLSQYESAIILNAVRIFCGNKTQAARWLGLNRNTLEKKLKEFNINVTGYKKPQLTKKYKAQEAAEAEQRVAVDVVGNEAIVEVDEEATSRGDSMVEAKVVDVIDNVPKPKEEKPKLAEDEIYDKRLGKVRKKQWYDDEKYM